MGFKLRFNAVKNQLLKSTRGVSFEEVIDALEEDGLLANIEHPSLSHSNQHMYIIRIRNYAYAVPYVTNYEKQEIFLKTIYPSSKFTKLYLRKGEQYE